MRGRHPVGFSAPRGPAPGSAIGITGGGGPVPGLAGAVVPGGGVELGRAINTNLLLSTMLDAGWNASARGTVSHQRRHESGEDPSPQQFVKLTTQGSMQSKQNIEATASTIRISRRALSRNRGKPGF